MYEEQDVMESYVESSPRPFGEIPGLWLQIFQMTEDFFRREAPRASGSNTVISVLIMGVISAVISVIVSAVGGGVAAMMAPAEMRGAAVAAAGGAAIQNLVCCAMLGPFVSLVLFYLSNGVLYVLARIFGGQGDFGQQAYLQSLYGAPIGVVTTVLSILSVIPVGEFIWGLASLVVGAYSFVLTVRMLKVVHNMTTGRAVAALLVPMIILVLIPCVIIMMMILMGPAIGNVFSNIVFEI